MGKSLGTRILSGLFISSGILGILAFAVLGICWRVGTFTLTDNQQAILYIGGMVISPYLIISGIYIYEDAAYESKF